MLETVETELNIPIPKEYLDSHIQKNMYLSTKKKSSNLIYAYDLVIICFGVVIKKVIIN